MINLYRRFRMWLLWRKLNKSMREFRATLDQQVAKDAMALAREIDRRKKGQ